MTPNEFFKRRREEVERGTLNALEISKDVEATVTELHQFELCLFLSECKLTMSDAQRTLVATSILLNPELQERLTDVVDAVAEIASHAKDVLRKP